MHMMLRLIRGMRQRLSGLAFPGCCLVVALAFCRDASAQTLFPILSNGPPAQRLNILVLSEGYNQSALAQFQVDATNLINGFLAAEPYNEYRQYFNAFGLAVASAESGSDHPSRSEFHDTYFNSTYDSYGIAQFLSIPPNNYDADPAHGQGKIAALVSNHFPNAHLSILLVNDIEYGGGGGALLVASRHPSSRYLTLHESGHTLAGLGDEYSDPLPGYPDTEEPNTTRETRRDFIKWRAWIADPTPLPTPPTALYANVIGLFEGAHYQTTGWFRPKLDCRMRTVTTSFCEVCAEALVKAIYQRVRPIETCAPAATNLFIDRAQGLTFSLASLRPATHALTMRWFTNGIAVLNATGTNLTLATAALGNGVHTVRAEARDATALVRNDPDNLLTDLQSWVVTINIIPAELRWGLPALAPNRQQISLSITGIAPAGVVIQTSANLSNWTSLATNFLTAGRFDFAVTNDFRQKFYRCLALP
jgi:hypothetical protein